MKLHVISVTALLLAAPAMAADVHSHGHAPAALSELKLDHGRKWATDAPLRQGMDGVRAALDAVHAGTLDFAGLEQAVERQIAFMVANCKLPPEADAQLHVVLGEVMQGAEMIGRPDQRQAGAGKLLAALEAYGAHFDHPGWRPITH